MALHYLNGIINENQLINKINKNAFKKGIKQMRKPEFNTPYTMNSYDVNDVLFYPEQAKRYKKTVVNGWLDDAWDNITSTVQTAATNVTSTVNTGIQNVITTTQQGIQNVVNTVQQAGTNALQNIQSTIQNTITSLNLPTNFVNRLNTFVNKMTNLVGTYGKKIAMQPMRTAFILATSTNALNLGTMLAQGWGKDRNKIINWWVNEFGGDINVLKTAISRGSKTTINGDIDPEMIMKAISACSMIITSIVAVLKSIGINIGPKDKETLSKVIPTDTPTSVNSSSATVETLPPLTTSPTSSAMLTEKNNTMLYVGLGGALLIGGYFYFKKK